VIKLAGRHTVRLIKRDNLLRGVGVGGAGGGGPKSFDGEKAWPSINHSILSALIDFFVAEIFAA
jgi:hypothetical protein